MIPAMIIDDEPSAVKTLQLLLEKYVPEIGPLYITNDPAEGISLIREKRPELVFLDIQMPVMSGFDMLKKLPDISCSIIFTTAHDQYAIEAIRFSALDYLMKPIDADELKNAVQRFTQKRVADDSSRKLYQNFLDNISGSQQQFTLALPTTEGTFFFKPEEIFRVEGENNYSRFFFSNRRPMMTSRTLKEYEEILSGHRFLRVHKSHLVNKIHVRAISGDGMLIMADETRIEISRRRKEQVIAALKKV
jgi:two-component system, LytTR family, response regulator